MRYENDTFVADVIDPKTQTSVTSGKFLSRTLMFTGIGLAVTLLLMFAVSIILKLTVGDALITIEQFGNIDALTEIQQNALLIYGIVLIVSAIVMFAMMIWINISMIAKGKVNLVAYLIYAGVMGIFLSSFSLVLPFWEIGVAIGITTIVFGLMALIGFLGGEKIKWFGLIGFGLLIGLSLIGLAAIPIFIFIPGTYAIYYLIFSIVSLLAILFITAFDFYRIKKIAQKGEDSKDLALYCAFNLYVDFIYILIRILSLLARAKK